MSGHRRNSDGNSIVRIKDSRAAQGQRTNDSKSLSRQSYSEARDSSYYLQRADEARRDYGVKFVIFED